MVMVKKRNCFRFLFLGKNDLEIMFGDLLVRKESFLPKGLTHDFGQKMAF